MLPSRRDVLRSAATVGAVAVAAPLGVPAPARAVGTAGGRPAGLEPVRYAFRLTKEEVSPVGPAQHGLVVNGRLPGPEIRFREGFLLRTEIANGIDQGTAIHWHGLPVPNPMDGEIGVTQLPLGPGAVGVYEFPAAEPGTYWYHSSAGYQRQLGLAGAFVVEERDDPYDVQRDQVVFLSDWPGRAPEAVAAGLRERGGEPEKDERQRFVNPGPDGKPFPTDIRFAGFLMNGRAHRNAWTCEAKEGARVRLRLVNGSAQTFFRFMIADHRLEVVAADGRPVVPVVVDDLVLGVGERYDVIVTVGAEGSYPIRAVALGQSGGAIGVLHTPTAKPGVSTVPPKWTGTSLRYDMLRARTPLALPHGAGRNLRVALSDEAPAYRFAVNGQSYPSDPATAEIPDALRIQPGERVRIEIDNKTRFPQSMHLHGHVFRLLRSGLDPESAPRKDTLWIAPGEQARIEFAADNPGRWLLEGTCLYRRMAGLARLIGYVEGTATR